jgi:hypothetical protein
VQYYLVFLKKRTKIQKKWEALRIDRFGEWGRLRCFCSCNFAVCNYEKEYPGKRVGGILKEGFISKHSNVSASRSSDVEAISFFVVSNSTSPTLSQNLLMNNRL